MVRATRPPIMPTLKKAWWQKGVFSAENGFGRWFQKIFGRYFQGKELVSESSLFLHQRAMEEVKILGKNAEALDNEKFGKKEFLVLVKLRYILAKGVGSYKGLNNSVELLQAAIDAKDSFITIDQAEHRFRGTKQQELYKFTDDLLKVFQTTKQFRQEVNQRFSEAIPNIQTEEGRVAMEGYVTHLDRLSEKPLGLKLLSLFKAYHLADYSILCQISDLVQGLNKTDLHQYETLIPLVKKNYPVFEKLGEIISLPKERSNPDTFAKMTQVLALNYKYRLSFGQFEDLLGMMKRWYRPYQTIIGIRENHPPQQYQQPPEFQELIAGEKVYLKYRNWLTDKKSGMVFLDFEDKE